MIDVRAEIANASIGRYHRFLALLVGAVVFFDGYDTFNPAYVIHYVMEPWHLHLSQAGLLVSSGLIGFMAGSLAQGKFSDRYGRRVTLLAALWIATIFSFATATLGHSFAAFCGLRLLTGIGLGALLPLGVTYVNEYAPRRFANTFSTWGWALGWAAGGVAAAAIGIFLTPALGWQVLYYVASLSAVLVPVCHLTASYDTEVRGTGVGMMLGVGRLGGILGPFVAGLLQQFTPGTVGLFVAIGVAVLIGAGAITFARPRPPTGIATAKSPSTAHYLRSRSKRGDCL